MERRPTRAIIASKSLLLGNNINLSFSFLFFISSNLKSNKLMNSFHLFRHRSLKACELHHQTTENACSCQIVDFIAAINSDSIKTLIESSKSY